MLPSELHQHIRGYSYNPLVSDENLYELIQDMDPYFSIRDLYYRYVNWLGRVEDFKKNALPTTLQLYDVLKDHRYFVDMDGPDCNIEGVPLEAFSNINLGIRHSEYGDSLVFSNVYVPNQLLSYINLINSNPLNPAILQYNWIFQIKYKGGSSTQYNGVKYDPFDSVTLQGLQALEPRYSLQKEYNRRQKISQAKPIPIIKEHKNDINTLTYDETNSYLSITADKLIEGLKKDNTYIGDYGIENVSKKEFLETSLYLWNGRYITNELEASSIYSIPGFNL